MGLLDIFKAEPRKPAEPIGDPKQLPAEVHFELDRVDKLTFEYQGVTYEVVKTEDGLELAEIQRRSDDG